MFRKEVNKRSLVLLKVAVFMSGIVLASCGKKESNEVVLRIANCEEYIDEGDWDEDETIELDDEEAIIGENSLVEDFEEWYEKTYGRSIKVEYRLTVPMRSFIIR